MSELQQLLAGVELVMLATRGRHGLPVSRPLQLLQVDAAGALWFFTSASSAKVAEIRADARVNVAYADPARKYFIAIAGEARIVVDRAKIDEMWTLAQTIFFPQGREDPSLVLLKVTPATARYWDGYESILGVLLKFGKAVLRNEASDLGHSGRIDLGGQD
jgi:general stress protein 26